MQHVISYAYATSHTAKRLCQARTGCWVYECNGKASAFANYAQAALYAKLLQTNPDRWSADHPANAQFLASA